MPDELPWLARKTTIGILAVAAILGGVAHFLTLRVESKHNDKMREEAVELLRQDHRQILDEVKGRRSLGYVETWDDGWKAETVHLSSMPWSAFADLHNFHERVAKP